MKAIISASLLTSKKAQAGPAPFDIRDTRLPGFILRVQPSGVRSYYAGYARNKRVVIAKVGEMTPDEAREHCTRIIGNHANGRPLMLGLTDSASLGDRTTLRQWIGEPTKGEAPAEGTWLHWAKARRPKSWYNTLSAVRTNFQDFYDVPLTAITTDKLNSHTTKRLGAGSPPASVRRDLDALAGMLTQAVKVRPQLLAVSPMKGVEKPKLDRNPRVRFLTLDEEGRLRAALAERDAEMIAARVNANKTRVRNGRAEYPPLLHFGDHLTPAVMLSMLTGMRLSELLRLKWSDVSDVITLELTKGVDTRHQPVVPELRALLKKWRAQSRPDSDSAYVLPVRSNMRRSWATLLQRARITGFRWNDLRHTYASIIMQEGGNLNTVRELLGHKELRTTLRYAHLGQSDKNQAAGLWTERLKKVARRVKAKA